MAGNGSVFEIEGLRFRKKRGAEESLYSAPKRHRAVPETSSKKQRVPVFAPAPFHYQKDYSQIDPSHRLGVLLSELLEHAENCAQAAFQHFPRLLSAINSLLNSVETRCKERLYSYLADREKARQELESAVKRRSVAQEDEKWRSCQRLAERAPENEAAASEVQFFSAVLQHVESTHPTLPTLPKVTVVHEKFAFPMQDELSRADELLKQQAERRAREATEFSLLVSHQLRVRKEGQRVAAYRHFSGLWPAIHTDPRKVLTRLASLPHKPEFDL